MGHWDDVSAVRAALAKKLSKQLARDFRHDRHGEVLLALEPPERELVLATGEPANEKVRALARRLSSERRFEEALSLYEAIAPHLDASVWSEALALVERSGAFERARVERLLSSARPHLRSSVELARAAARVASALGETALAIEAVQAAVLGGIDPEDLAADPALSSIHGDARFREASRALFPPRAPARDVDLAALSRAWTDPGRAHLTAQHPHLVAIYERGEDPEIAPDPRDPALADAVIDAVLREATRDEPLRIESMRLSGDGTRVLVIGYRQGVLLGSRRAGEPAWRYVGGAGEDMLHGDLSDDGRWLVHGSQGSVHEILSIRDDGSLEPHARVGWLGVDGAFALVGAGVVRIVSSEGVLVVAQVLASSGSSADFHPGLGLLAVGTYAGQLHVLDTRRGAPIGTQDGWTRGGASAGLHEVRRWLLWPALAGGPVAW